MPGRFESVTLPGCQRAGEGAGIPFDSDRSDHADWIQRAGAPARGVTEGLYAERSPNVRPAEENFQDGWPTVIHPGGTEVALWNLCLRGQTVGLESPLNPRTALQWRWNPPTHSNPRPGHWSGVRAARWHTDRHALSLNGSQGCAADEGSCCPGPSVGRGMDPSAPPGSTRGRLARLAAHGGPIRWQDGRVCARHGPARQRTSLHAGTHPALDGDHWADSR